MSFEVLEERENPLLNRRELICVFRGGAGKVTRADVVKVVSEKFNVPSEQVIPINIKHSHGIRDVTATVYIYKNLEDAKRQLPKHIMLRLLPKEERKKLLEQKRKPKEEKKK